MLVVICQTISPELLITMFSKGFTAVIWLALALFVLTIADENADEHIPIPNHEGQEGKSDNSTFPKEVKLREDLLKSIGMIVGRLMGGQSIVCTALNDGTEITLDGSSSSGKSETGLVILSALILKPLNHQCLI